jgi:hypothetical protein
VAANPLGAATSAASTMVVSSGRNADMDSTKCTPSAARRRPRAGKPAAAMARLGRGARAPAHAVRPAARAPEAVERGETSVGFRAVRGTRHPRLAGVGSRVTPGGPRVSQARKLGLAPGQRVALDGAPPGWRLEDPPPGIGVVQGAEPADVIVAFFAAAEELPRRLPGLVARIAPGGALWAAWPRRAGGHASDITDATVRREALALGVVDVKVAAIDDDWSGLRFVRRAGSGA